MMESYHDLLRDYLGSPQDITASIVHYVTSTALPALDKNASVINVKSVESPIFTASVEWRPKTGHKLCIYSGVAQTLATSLQSIDTPAIETLAALSENLFGSPDFAHVVAGSVLSSAVIFVCLHEYGHVAGGHFELRRCQRTEQDRGFEFNETTDDFSYEGKSGNAFQFSQLLELEADLIAFNLLLDLSYPIVVANEDVAALMRGREFENWRDELHPRVAELTFYAAAIALGLLSVHRANENSETHPWPITRMMYIAMLLLRRTVPGWQSGSKLAHFLKIDETALAHLTGNFLPTLLNAIELAESCCRGIGLDLPHAMGLSSGAPEFMSR
ncbi:MAG: hypothetical protein WB816_09750, partial [Methylocystis sp.]